MGRDGARALPALRAVRAYLRELRLPMHAVRHEEVDVPAGRMAASRVWRETMSGLTIRPRRTRSARRPMGLLTWLVWLGLSTWGFVEFIRIMLLMMGAG